MKKIIICLLAMGILGTFTPVVLADTSIDPDVVAPQSHTGFKKFFSSYPPKTFNGRTLVHVETTKGGYLGWYL